MPPISTKLHGALDYAGGAALVAAPKFLRGKDPRAAALLRLAGVGTLATSALTDYEFGIRRVLPVPVHLMIDAATGSMLTAGGFALRRRGGFAILARFALLGGGEIAAAALTARTPGDRPGGEAVPAAPGEEAVPGAPASAGPAVGTSPADGPPLAPAPVQTPGPSVTPPEFPQSDVEREERVDANLPLSEAPPPDDVLAAQEASAAAAEAAMIGGAAPSETGDPAMDPVYQAGGGEQEGWDTTERDLVENAAHGDGGGNPERDAFTPELESDLSTAEYAETDRTASTEVVEDPGAGPDDPGSGPDLAAERGTDSPPREEPPSQVE